MSQSVWANVPGQGYGIAFGPDLLGVPPKFPDAVAPVTLALPSPPLPGLPDLPQSATLASAPSGSGELTVSAFSIINGNAVFTTGGGQPYRHYRLRIVVTMISGAVVEFVAEQVVGALLPTDQAQPIPSTGFGTAVTWAYLPSLDFSQVRNGMWRLLGWG